MRFLLHTAICFLAGAVAAVNLEALIGTNPYYDAQWWKVLAGVVTLFIVTAHLANENP